MRREFTKAIKVEIIKRATPHIGHGPWPFCEQCCLQAKKFEIDHRDPDAMQIDKSRKLTAADGWLLCIPCHDDKTKIDVADIAKAKRVEAKAIGADKPKKGWAKVSKEKPPMRVAAGDSEIMRRFR